MASIIVLKLLVYSYSVHFASYNSLNYICKGETDVEKPSTHSVVQKENKHVELVQTEEKMEFQPVVSSSPQKSPTESAEAPIHSNEQLTKKNVLVTVSYSALVVL